MCRPFRAQIIEMYYPGRCPGLVCDALSGLRKCPPFLKCAQPMFENELETFASDIGSQTIVVRRANTRFAPTLVSEIGWISITTIYPKIYARLLKERREKKKKSLQKNNKKPQAINYKQFFPINMIDYDSVTCRGEPCVRPPNKNQYQTYEQNQCRGEPYVRPPNKNRYQTYVRK